MIFSRSGGKQPKLAAAGMGRNRARHRLPSPVRPTRVFPVTLRDHNTQLTVTGHGIRPGASARWTARNSPKRAGHQGFFFLMGLLGENRTAAFIEQGRCQDAITLTRWARPVRRPSSAQLASIADIAEMKFHLTRRGRDQRCGEGAH
jgi:hypothetical protein